MEHSADAALGVMKCNTQAGTQCVRRKIGAWFGADLKISDTHNDGRHLLSDSIEGGSHSGCEEANRFEE
jgi:hypothetical protein